MSQIHQALPVHGYKPQADDKVELVNQNKTYEEFCLRMLDRYAESPDIDKRWLAIGRTHLEQAFMAINRAVFQPNRVKLPEAEALEAKIIEKPTIAELEKILESNDYENVHINPDGTVIVRGPA